MDMLLYITTTKTHNNNNNRNSDYDFGITQIQNNKFVLSDDNAKITKYEWFTDYKTISMDQKILRLERGLFMLFHIEMYDKNSLNYCLENVIIVWVKIIISIIGSFFA